MKRVSSCIICAAWLWVATFCAVPALAEDGAPGDATAEPTVNNTAPASPDLPPLTVQEALQEIIEQAAGHSNITQKSHNKNKIVVAPKKKPKKTAPEISVAAICAKIGSKLGSVSNTDCLAQNFALSGGKSVNGLPIVVKEYPPVADRKPQARILLLGGIHGDEFSSVSVVFKWLKILDKYHSGLFHWRIAPLVNPDGLLQKRSQRMNANRVDLNRNFPTAATDRERYEESRKYWIDETYRDPRRYPGPAPLSEPESSWVAAEIERFKPHAVVSVHAPFGLLDFDGPPNTPPERLGQLYLSLLGTYPGSLGRYVGTVRLVPIITIELEHAGIMPSKKEVNSIWKDLVRWLAGHVKDRGSRLSKKDNALLTTRRDKATTNKDGL